MSLSSVLLRGIRVLEGHGVLETCVLFLNIVWPFKGILYELLSLSIDGSNTLISTQTVSDGQFSSAYLGQCMFPLFFYLTTEEDIDTKKTFFSSTVSKLDISILYYINCKCHHQRISKLEQKCTTEDSFYFNVVIAGCLFIITHHMTS